MTRPTDAQLLHLAQQTIAEIEARPKEGEPGYRRAFATSSGGPATVPSVQGMLQKYLAQVDHNADVAERSHHAWGLPDDASGPWMLFAGQDYYPGGGWNDCVGEFSLWSEVVVRIQAGDEDWAHAVYENEIVASWHSTRLYPILNDVEAGDYWLREDDQ